MGWVGPGSICSSYTKQVMETIMVVSFIENTHSNKKCKLFRLLQHVSLSALCQRHWWQMEKIFNHKSFNYFVWRVNL
jgi:hypothetical protein